MAKDVERSLSTWLLGWRTCGLLHRISFVIRPDFFVQKGGCLQELMIFVATSVQSHHSCSNLVSFPTNHRKAFFLLWGFFIQRGKTLWHIFTFLVWELCIVALTWKHRSFFDSVRWNFYDIFKFVLSGLIQLRGFVFMYYIRKKS